MKRLFKILLGLSVGAAIGMLFAPKSGKELRQQLLGTATGRMLPAAPVEFPQPEHERDWGGAATAVAEPPAFEAEFSMVDETEAIVEETVIIEEKVITDEGVVEDLITIEERIVTPEGEVLEETVIEEETLTVEEETLVVEEPAADTVDLRTRIEETRTEVETSLAEPFGGGVPAEDAEVRVDEPSLAEEPLAEEPVAEARVIG